MSPYILISVVLLQCARSHSVSGTPRDGSRENPTVSSKVGRIRGLQASDGDYAMFLGIPYAKVDENNVFGDSIPYPKFEVTFEAYNDTKICPQPDIEEDEFNKTVVSTLDCLHLNVFVPTSATFSNRLPVMVWIYGGGFTVGSSDAYLYGPKFLVRHDIVLVTLNYRLGPYGFMCPGISEVSGNQGLKDQRKALRWVKENIEAFGGDADKITIFGESAGAASVDFHLYSEENLFSKAILQSGVILSPWTMQNPGVEGSLKLAEHLGRDTKDVREALSFLAKIDTHLVINATKELGLSFRVCVEIDFENVDIFVRDYPVNSNSVPKVKNIPILIGFNSDEELLSYAKVDNEFLKNSDIIHSIINNTFDMNPETFNEMSEILRHYYFGDEDVNEETRREVIDISSDFNFVYPTQRTLYKYYNNGVKAVFSYMFSYIGKRNLERSASGINFGGALHSDELGYLFDVSYMKSVLSEEDQNMIDRITTLWTNFAKYGDPTPEITDLLPVKWAPTTKDRWNYLNIDSDMTLKSRPFSKRMAFLDLFFNTNKKHLIGYHGIGIVIDLYRGEDPVLEILSGCYTGIGIVIDLYRGEDPVLEILSGCYTDSKDNRGKETHILISTD